jgi:hypothetical protein
MSNHGLDRITGGLTADEIPEVLNHCRPGRTERQPEQAARRRSPALGQLAAEQDRCDAWPSS